MHQPKLKLLPIGTVILDTLSNELMVIKAYNSHQQGYMVCDEHSKVSLFPSVIDYDVMHDWIRSGEWIEVGMNTKAAEVLYGKSTKDN